MTPVDQIVGRMDQVLPARQVLAEMVKEYFDTVDRMTRLMEETEEAGEK